MAFVDLALRLREFAHERDWEQFHSPKNLAISISIEAAELLELFQWSRGQDNWRCLDDPAIRARTEEELADIALYLIRFADKAGIDLEQAAMRKLARNAAKYPAEQFRGSDRKYDE
ncbi:MAG: nucleotide pyrophosphohydrolase [Burkholderiaceae bacterium]|nr:nucleotide pyrophosphohydrolase [Burkholderiaceae bacterium]